MLRRRRLVQAMLFESGVNGLGETGFLEPDDFGSFQAEESFEFVGAVMLDHGIMFELGKNFLPAIVGEVVRDENEMEFAFAASERVAADEEDARAEHEREQAFDGFCWARISHR